MTIDAATDYSLAHYLLATEGIALIRTWYADEDGRSARLIEEVADICRSADKPPYSDSISVQSAAPVAGYTIWAPTYDTENQTNPLIPLEAVVLDELLKPAGSPGARALDAACGTGRQAPRLLSLGYEVTGTDATHAMLEVARRRNPEATYLEGDVRALPVPDGHFDLVLTTLALTHVSELEKVVEEFARVLRPGGRAVIVDVHPVQVLLGSQVVVGEPGESRAVRNYTHLASRYLAAFAANGLTVRDCREPLFTEESVAELPAAEYIPEANRAAFLGTPALIVWDVEKEEH